jgi:hypothetical protein
MLLGKGVLAIWNGIEPAAEEEFVAWHVREHIPERVSLPGFLRGRRYVAIDGHPKYFNFYETQSADDLRSAAYVARLNAPTEWTRRVVARFRDTSRTICKVAWSIGQGEGGFIEAIVLEPRPDAGPFEEKAHGSLSAAYDASAGLTGVHLLEGQTGPQSPQTAEAKLRGTPDKVAPWILLVEASTPEALYRFRAAEGDAAALSAIGVGSILQRGIYQVQFTLTKV